MMRTMLTGAICGLYIMAAGVPNAEAQDHKSHWGVSGSLVPRWSFPRVLADTIGVETDMQGHEFRVGIVRGSDAGGDWGISYIKKLVEDDSVVQHRKTACVQLSGAAVECARGAYDVTHQARMTGVEAYLFMPFADIKRVQIGGTFGAGVARLEGSSSRYLEHLVVNGSSATRMTENLGEVSFRDTLHDWKKLSVLPIGRAELGVGVLLSPGFKLRVSAGLNFPGYHRVSVHAHYLFGARSSAGPGAQTP